MVDNINDLGFNPNDLHEQYDDIRIKEYCYEWVEHKISKSFKFRENQLECIVRIIHNVLDHKYQNYICEAPTGSGKSLINIIAAGVLADYFDMTSYILVSDLFLWDQYEKFLKKHKNTGIAALKGQTGNYTCLINGEDIKNADCRIAQVSWPTLFTKSGIDNSGYDCAYKCKYVQARKKAIKSKVCIMTYQLFLFIMNNPMFNKDSHGAPIFSTHDILFCDECHNIPEIVQLQYAPAIFYDDFDKLKKLYHQSTNYQLDLFNIAQLSDNLSDDTDINKLYEEYDNWETLYIKLLKFWKTWTCPQSRKDEDITCIKEYLDILKLYIPVVNSIKNDFANKKLNKEHISKEDIQLFKLCSWHENYMCHWNDFNEAIAYTGVEYMIKDANISDKNKYVKDEDICVTFKCTKEDYITWRFLLSKVQHKVMLSATVGTKDAFDERMGFQYEKQTKWKHPNSIINESYMEVLPSIFNFDESPVYFFNKFKMSYREREYSFNHLKTVIYSICSTKFKNQKGMIQTGSYEFAKKLYDNAPKELKARMLTYKGSRDKVNTVKLHQMSKDTILVGPTLNTGVDLPGDDCRFIIILKVPYPTLIDKLICERNKLYPLWYNSHTSNEIIQGIGRGVRYDGDWCVTYILDACFNSLYRSTKNQYPIELQERIKYV